MIIENKLYYNQLFDIYGELLTNKQKEVYEYYFFDDLSIIEIATILDVSKIAVYNNIQKSLKKLDLYEREIGYLELLEKYQKLKRGTSEI